LKSSSEHRQQNPHIGKRKAQEEKVPQESNFNVFRVVTCVKVDGWAFEVQKKRTNEWKLLKYSFEKGKV